MIMKRIYWLLIASLFIQNAHAELYSISDFWPNNQILRCVSDPHGDPIKFSIETIGNTPFINTPGNKYQLYDLEWLISKEGYFSIIGSVDVNGSRKRFMWLLGFPWPGMSTFAARTMVEIGEGGFCAFYQK